MNVINIPASDGDPVIPEDSAPLGQSPNPAVTAQDEIFNLLWDMSAAILLDAENSNDDFGSFLAQMVDCSEFYG